MTLPNIKAVIFDIGGVVLGSPIIGVLAYERLYKLPHNYINVGITAGGPKGAFQQLEMGKLGLEEFYIKFGEELSDSKRGGPAYEKYCSKMGIACPKLPLEHKVDGKELWTIMMAQAQEPDPLMITVINLLRESNRYKIAALTNNFVVPSVSSSSSTPSSVPSTSSSNRVIKGNQLTNSQLLKSIEAAAIDPKAAGAPTLALKSMFDMFFESALEGMRKPDPAFYQLALRKLGIQASEAVFLDDIGINLTAARKLGINTIRVHPGKSLDAIKELEGMLGLNLRKNGEGKL